MNLRIRRNKWAADGVFSEVTDEKGTFLFMGLEHAYLQDDGSFKSKIPNGAYLCKRGEHQLHSMEHPFETFEIEGVTGHTNILFHMGNYNADSDGCLLLGRGRGKKLDGGEMIMDSLKAFKAFMELQKECDEFTVTFE